MQQCKESKTRSKHLSSLAFLTLLLQPFYEKENPEFKPFKLRFNIHPTPLSSRTKSFKYIHACCWSSNIR